MLKKKLLLFLLLITSISGFSQTITPQWKPVTGGLMSYFYPAKSPAGYDTLWNAQKIRSYVNNGVNPFTLAIKRYADSLHNQILTGNNKYTGIDTFSVIRSQNYIAFHGGGFETEGGDNSHGSLEGSQLTLNSIVLNTYDPGVTPVGDGTSLKIRNDSGMLFGFLSNQTIVRAKDTSKVVWTSDLKGPNSMIAGKADTSTILLSSLPVSLNNQTALNASSFIQDNITTFAGFQYVVGVMDGNTPFVAKRKLPNGSWQVKNLTNQLGVVSADEHNYISIAVDNSGFIHIVGNQHNNPLNYIKSTVAQDITNFATATMVGINETSTTYPRWMKKTDGSLFFYYRNGVSGDGNGYLNKYNTSTSTWSRVNQITNGLTDTTSAYENRIYFDANNRLNISYTNRKTTNPNTNSNFYYYYSDDDGATFKNTAGTTQTLPMRLVLQTPVYTSAQNTGIINQTGMATDTLGNLFIVSTKIDGSGNTQLFELQKTGTVWTNRFITSFTSGFWDIGGLTSNRLITRPSVFSYKGNTYVVYTQRFDPVTARSGVRIIDITPSHTLKEVGLLTNNLGNWEASYANSDIKDGKLTMLLTTVPTDSIPTTDRYKGIVYSLKLNKIDQYFNNLVDISALSANIDYMTYSGFSKEDLVKPVMVGGDGVTQPEGALTVYKLSNVANAIGSTQLIRSDWVKSNLNILKDRVYALRATSDTTWKGITYHQGIAVDGTFSTLTTDKTYWERNANAGTQAWGNGGVVQFNTSPTLFTTFVPISTQTVIPNTDVTYNLGSNTARWSSIFGGTVLTNNIRSLSGDINIFNSTAAGIGKIFNTTGNFVIGTTPTDGGYKLDAITSGANGYFRAGSLSVNASNIPIAPTAASGTNTTQLATTAFVQSALTLVARTPLLVSANITMSLNADYLNTTTTQYTLTTPATTGFTTDGSKIITGLATGTGGFKVVCPTGYSIKTPSGTVTPVTGSAIISQNQKFQLIPIGTNSYYLQPLNGTITVS